MQYRNFTPPSEKAKKPLTAEQTDRFYNAACEMTNLRDELTGRILLDYGLRLAEFTHMHHNWVNLFRHPKTGDMEWCIQIPQGEKCTTGAGSTGMGNPDGKDMHNTEGICYNCRTRSYKEKDWVDDDFHQKYPFHPKTENSIGRTWALPTTSCEEATELLEGFLKPDRQWPVGHRAVRRALDKIRKKADLNRDVKPHALRHTYGCRLAAAGKNPQAIMSQMRHGDLGMTMYYSELRGTRIRDQIRDGWDAKEDF